jgi:hypothetical protein
VRRRLVAAVATAAALAACSGGSSPPAPTPAETTFAVEACPVDERRFCQEASALANALTQSSVDALLALSRRERHGRGATRGYGIGSARGVVSVVSADEYRAMLERLVQDVDDAYSDEIGGGEPRVLGVSTCEGANPKERSHHLVYTVALGGGTSARSSERFLGTFELTRRNREWAVSVAFLAPLAAWRRVLDDPLGEIGCGDVRPWGP